MNTRHESKLVASLLALGTVAIGACGTNDDKQTQPQQQAEKINVEDIEDDAQKYYGRQVELRGEIDDILGPQAFELESDGFFEDDLLVVMKGNQTPTVEEDNEVMVKGTIRPLVIADIEREIGWDLDRQIEVEYEAKAVLVADSVEVVGEKQKDQQAANQDVITDVKTLAAAEQQDPQQMIGKKVRLQDVQVRTVNGDKTFWIGPSHTEQVFVTLGHEPKTPSTPIEGEVKVEETRRIAQLTGTVEELPSADEMKEKWQIDAATLEVLKNMKLYIKADKVEMGQS